jgi:ATP-dependent Clp protease ATP-binding subunit ClpC
MNYSQTVLFAWQIAAGEAFYNGDQFIEKEHIFIGLCKVSNLLQPQVVARTGLQVEIDVIKKEICPLEEVFNSLSLDPTSLRRKVRELMGKGKYQHDEKEVIHRSDTCKEIFNRANIIAQNQHSILNPCYLFKVILEYPGPHITQSLKEAGVEIEELKKKLDQAHPYPHAQPGKTPYLDKFGRDLTALAREGKLSLLIGRRDELLDVIRVLLRTTKNNPVLIGEPGVGKTVIVEGLAQRIVSGNIYPEFREKRLIELNLSSLVAGTRFRGEFEERLEKILKEVKEDPQVTLFIDEIHNMTSAGAAEGALDAANILKPALARGEIRCIGATTIDEYRKRIEKDSALERRFQPILIEEPSREETLKILRGLKGRFEERHGVRIVNSALEASVKLAVRYLIDRRLPDKAIDLLEDASVQKKVPTLSFHEGMRDYSKPEVTDDDIARVVSRRTGIPLEKLTEDERKRILRIEEYLKENIIGQDRAIATISGTIKKASVGLFDPKRPLGVFLFVGPTGVGKTETAKALAQFLFDSEEAIIRLDMSEYMERHTVSRLIGAPPGYVGYEEEGQLTKKLRTRPYSLVLLDEIEKAHPEVVNIFLSVFDEGRITDAKGRGIDARSSLFIMTSNIGGEIYQKNPLGFQDFNNPDSQDLWREVMAKVKKSFSPEFLNRVEVVFFRALKEKDVVKVAYSMLKDFGQRLNEKGIIFVIDDEAIKFISQQGYEPSYGARHLRRVVEKLVVDPISEMILKGELRSGKVVNVELRDGTLEFKITEIDMLAEMGDTGTK